MRQHRPFLLLLAVYIVGVLAQGFTLPVMEGSDESIHSTYIELLRHENRLPSRLNVRDTSTRQESGQPPLTYWIAARIADGLRLPSTDDDALLDHLYTIRNSWLTPPNSWNRRDNLNHYLHGDDERAFNAPEIVTTDRALRLTSLVYGILAVIGAYGAAREIFRHPSWALTATAIFAFTPTFIQVSAYVNNDISAIAFSTLAIWHLLRLLRLGASKERLLMLGVLLAAGALSKVSVMLVVPGVGLALLFDAYNRRLSLGHLLLNGLLVAVPVVALFGPWVAWGWLQYRDPFGFMTHLNPTLSYSELLPLSRVVALMPEIYLSYWAKFGLAKVYLNPVTYVGMSLLAVMAITGWLISAFTSKRNTVRQSATIPVRRTFQQAVVLLIIGLVVFVGLVRWMQEIAIITGRLMYPAHVVIAIGLAGGLYGLARRFPSLTRPLQYFTIGLLAAAGILYTPAALYQAYSEPPMLARDALPALSGGPFDYGGVIRLLGITQESPMLTGRWHTITLCWEVLQSTDRSAAFSVKLVRDGVIVADRTSYHGLGHFPSDLWEQGDIFCDAVDLPYDDPDVPDDPLPQPGTTYDILVVMLDAKTFDVNWQPTAADGTPVQFPILGQVTAP